MQTRVNVLLVSSRCVVGQIEHGAVRLSDALSNPLESVLRVTDAKLGRLGNEEANESVGVAVIPKSHVALVYSRQEPTRPVEKRLSSYKSKQTTRVLVLVAGLRMSGEAHATAELDPVDFHRLVADRENRFVVLTGARLALDVEGQKERPVGVAMLNSRHIQFVARYECVNASAKGTLKHLDESIKQIPVQDPELLELLRVASQRIELDPSPNGSHAKPA
jgi:hypothetical protein